MDRQESPPERARCPLCGDTGSVTNFLRGMTDDRYGCPSVVDIERCADCEHFFCWPPLDRDDVGSLYENFYGRSGTDSDDVLRLARANVADHAWKRWFRGETNSGQFHAPSHSRVLDIGSGACQDVLEAQLLGHEARGFDVDRTSVQIGRAVGVEVRTGPDVRLAFADDRFDWIQLNQVIEHYVDPVSTLAAVVDLLEPGGRMFLATPNASSLLRRLTGRRWINWHVPYHQQHFTRRSLRQTLEASGLQIESARTVTPAVWFLLQIRALLTRPSVGTASATWSDRPAANGPRDDLLQLALRIAMLGASVMSRLLDVARVGESLVVVARKPL